MYHLRELSEADLDALAGALQRERARREGLLDGVDDAAPHARIAECAVRNHNERADDAARHLLLQALDWDRAETSGDLVTAGGRTVAMCARRSAGPDAAGTFLAIAADAGFDLLACIVLAADFTVRRAVLLEREELRRRAIPGRTPGTLDLPYAAAFRLGHGAYDIAARLAAAPAHAPAPASVMDGFADHGPVGGDAGGHGPDRHGSRGAARLAPTGVERPAGGRRRRGVAPQPSLRAQLAASLALTRPTEPLE